MIVVTGGAGFIGSNIIAGLNQRGEEDILLVDDLTRTEKLPNIADLKVVDYMDKQEFRDLVGNGQLGGEVRAIFHEGACSDTMATDGRYVMDNNYRFSKELYRFSQNNSVQYIYASSASVYGANTTFVEDPAYEHPLNAYAYSKFQFDRHIRRFHPADGAQTVGLRYFNVYGYREQHKHRMASVAYHFRNQYLENGKLRLFEGSAGYAHGEQRRDFVFIEDVVAVNLFFLDNPDRQGIFNLGTGKSHSFNDVAVAVINSLASTGAATRNLEELVTAGEIEYMPMPEALHGKYQSFTEANIDALREIGYDAPFADVTTGVDRYVDWMGRS